MTDTEKKRDLRQSLAAKTAAIILFFAAAAGAVIGTIAVTLLSCGYGAANTFQDDILYKDKMNTAMDYALTYVVMAEEDDSARYLDYLTRTYMERAGGFSAQVFQGAPANGKLLGEWSQTPSEEQILCRSVMTAPIRDEAGQDTGEYYTVVGYLSNDIPAGSDFAVRFSVYNHLRSLPFGVTVVLTIALCVCALTALVFLFCAAGHRRGREEICLNWQDRVPLDLYLCLVIGLFCVAILPGVAGADSGMPAALTIASVCLSAVGGTAVLLAVMLLLTVPALAKGRLYRLQGILLLVIYAGFCAVQFSL